MKEWIKARRQSLLDQRLRGVKTGTPYHDDLQRRLLVLADQLKRCQQELLRTLGELGQELELSQAQLAQKYMRICNGEDPT